jgi:hypothetical protein
VNEINLNVSGAQATLATVNNLPASLSGMKVGPRIGTAVKVLLQKHFLSNPKNRMGWPSQNFWPAAARSVSYTVQPDATVVTVAKQGVAQQVFGGQIRPVRSKLLTIPANADAYGKRAREFPNLRFALLGSEGRKQPALIEAEATRLTFGRKRKDGTRSVKGRNEGGRVMFWLVPRVNQKGDRSKLPSEAAIRDTAVGALRDAVDLAIRRQGGATA